MMVLIPGFGTGLNSKILKERYKNGGFFIFDDMIAAHKAVVFKWTDIFDLGWKESLHIPLWVQYYWADREKVSKNETLYNLAEFIHHHKPNTIVAHSLGTELFWECTKLYPLPKSVKKVVFVQSDLVHEVDQDHPLSVAARNKDIEFINVFCPADPNLLLSSFLHTKPRAGLLGLDLAGCRNILLPWLWSINIHSAPLSHPWFKKVVAGELQQ
jgi:hypothetical protein